MEEVKTAAKEETPGGGGVDVDFRWIFAIILSVFCICCQGLLSLTVKNEAEVGWGLGTVLKPGG